MAVRHELNTDPRQEMLDIMLLRTYARTKAAIDTATDQAAAARLPLAEWVFDHIATLVQERSRG
jgi:hypothetical protein